MKPLTGQMLYEVLEPSGAAWGQRKDVHNRYGVAATKLNVMLAEQEQPKHEKKELVFRVACRWDDPIEQVEQQVNTWLAAHPDAIIVSQNATMNVNVSGEDQFAIMLLVELPIPPVDLQNTINTLASLGYHIHTDAANAYAGEHARWAFRNDETKQLYFCNSPSDLVELLNRVNDAELEEPAPDAFDQFLPGQEVARTQPLTEEVAE